MDGPPGRHFESDLLTYFVVSFVAAGFVFVIAWPFVGLSESLFAAAVSFLVLFVVIAGVAWISKMTREETEAVRAPTGPPDGEVVVAPFGFDHER